ncbi:hypothetical protein ABW19_dt0208328 [Dactylella cylindrospora]|nr:hypothetical protein ABW19_dt0208328 [Dactylella cylindrospora]
MKRKPISSHLYEDPANISTENISDLPLDENFTRSPSLPPQTQSSPATPSGMNTLREARTWTPGSEPEYMTPDVAEAAGGPRWRANSPLSNQVMGGEETDEESATPLRAVEVGPPPGGVRSSTDYTEMTPIRISFSKLE